MPTWISAMFFGLNYIIVLQLFSITSAVDNAKTAKFRLAYNICQKVKSINILLFY